MYIETYNWFGLEILVTIQLLQHIKLINEVVVKYLDLELYGLEVPHQISINDLLTFGKENIDFESEIFNSVI